ncbi:suppressor of fused domain protein, partial [Xanthomonas sp. Kuri4-1]
MGAHGGIGTTDSPGWDAIDAELARHYPQQSPRHYGALLSPALGGNDPLYGISAYWRDLPQPHWHFVTYGFSELYDKEGDDPEISGWGFELTFRLAAAPGSEPPNWALNFLQNLARYVFGSGNPFEHGHYLNANGPIAADSDSLIRAVAFVRDPELATLQTPNGRVEFLQVVGLTDDEELAIKRWSTVDVLEALVERMPLWITSLERGSLLADPSVAAAIDAGAARDGSQTGFLFVEHLDWTLQPPQGELVIGANQVASLLGLLPGRLPFGQDLRLIGSDRQVRLAPAAVSALEDVDGVLECRLDAPALAAL